MLWIKCLLFVLKVHLIFADCNVTSFPEVESWQSSAYDGNVVQEMMNLMKLSNKKLEGSFISRVSTGECTQTTDESDPWIQIQLDDDHYITSVTMTSPPASENSVLENVLIEVASIQVPYANLTWPTAWNDGKRTCVLYVSRLPDDATFPINCTWPVLGNFVRVTKLTGNATSMLSICEVVANGILGHCDVTPLYALEPSAFDPIPAAAASPSSVSISFTKIETTSLSSSVISPKPSSIQLNANLNPQSSHKLSSSLGEDLFISLTSTQDSSFTIAPTQTSTFESDSSSILPTTFESSASSSLGDYFSSTPVLVSWISSRFQISSSESLISAILSSTQSTMSLIPSSAQIPQLFSNAPIISASSANLAESPVNTGTLLFDLSFISSYTETLTESQETMDSISNSLLSSVYTPLASTIEESGIITTTFLSSSRQSIGTVPTTSDFSEPTTTVSIPVTTSESTMLSSTTTPSSSSPNAQSIKSETLDIVQPSTEISISAFSPGSFVFSSTMSPLPEKPSSVTSYITSSSYEIHVQISSVVTPTEHESGSTFATALAISSSIYSSECVDISSSAASASVASDSMAVSVSQYSAESLMRSTKSTSSLVILYSSEPIMTSTETSSSLSSLYSSESPMMSTEIASSLMPSLLSFNVPSSTVPVWCPCSCEHFYLIKNLTSTNKTNDEVADELEVLINDMTVDSKTTSVNQGKLNSAGDERTSAKIVGTIGMAFFIGTFMLIFLSDVPILFKLVKRLLRSARNMRRKKQRKLERERPESRRKFSSLEVIDIEYENGETDT